MTFAEVQSRVAALLTVEDALNGIPVLLEDGSYPRLSGREQAHRSPGVCLIVFPVESAIAETPTRGVPPVLLVDFAIVIEESRRTNRSNAGSGLVAEEIIRRVQQCLLAPKTPAGHSEFRVAADEAFVALGMHDGVEQWVVNFEARCTLV